MRDKEELYTTLEEIDGRDYEEYSQLVGDFDFTRYIVRFDKIDKDSSNPTLFIVRVPQFVAGFPGGLYNTPVRRTALEDYLTRSLAEELEDLAHFDEDGVARRRLAIAVPEQKILPRTSIAITEEYVEARLYVDFPCRDGLVNGNAARQVFFDDLPEAVGQSLLYCNLDDVKVNEFVNSMEDADQVRQILPTRGWIGFVGEGSKPKRLPGTDYPDLDDAKPLRADDNLVAEVETPNSGTLRGFGIPAGVTLILGEPYSGRDELMRAVAAGIYNHVPGDGRENIVTVSGAVYISSDPERSVQRVDVSAFLQSKGRGRASSSFSYSSPAADAVAAQAAATVEALEIGARVLVFDESDSSGDFLTRDSRLEALTDPEDHVVTPLSAIARQLADELGVSVIVGGSANVAEFIPIADRILKVSDHVVRDVTEEVRQIGVEALPSSAGSSHELARAVESSRWIIPSSIDPSLGRHDAFIEAPETSTLIYGKSIVDLGNIHQLADRYQTKTIGLVINYARLRYMEQGRPIHEVLDLVDRDLSSEGLECLSRELRGDLTRPRRYEIAAALNRLDSLRVTQTEEPQY